MLKKFVEFSLIILKVEVNFFIREFLEVFYFPSDFIVVAEIFKGYLRYKSIFCRKVAFDV